MGAAVYVYVCRSAVCCTQANMMTKQEYLFGIVYVADLIRWRFPRTQHNAINCVSTGILRERDPEARRGYSVWGGLASPLL